MTDLTLEINNPVLIRHLGEDKWNILRDILNDPKNSEYIEISITANRWTYKLIKEDSKILRKFIYQDKERYSMEDIKF